MGGVVFLSDPEWLTGVVLSTFTNPRVGYSAPNWVGTCVLTSQGPCYTPIWLACEACLHVHTDLILSLLWHTCSSTYHSICIFRFASLRYNLQRQGKREVAKTRANRRREELREGNWKNQENKWSLCWTTRLLTCFHAMGAAQLKESSACHLLGNLFALHAGTDMGVTHMHEGLRITPFCHSNTFSTSSTAA